MLKTEAKEQRVLVIFTGGTIGSTCKEGIIDVDNSTSTLLSLYQKQFSPLHVHFEIHNAFSILSENLNAPYMQELLSIITLHRNNYDGIILTHGTDTLAFSAALLALYFQDSAIPIMLVSSQLPLHNPNANGILNFHASVRYIQSRLHPGVFVAYQNRDEVCKIHQAHLLSQSFQLSSRFESLNNSDYMHFNNTIFTQKSDYQQVISVTYNYNLSDNITLIYPYPSIDYSAFVIPKGSRILLSTYHSGTLPQSVEAFILTCKERECAIYICGIPKQEDYYATTKQVQDSGATILYDMSVEVAYAYLLLNAEINHNE